MDWEIEKDVPFKLKGQYADLLMQMEIGDSVVMGQNEAIALQCCAGRYGCKIARRKINEYQFRVWLIHKEGVDLE